MNIDLVFMMSMSNVSERQWMRSGGLMNLISIEGLYPAGIYGPCRGLGSAAAAAPVIKTDEKLTYMRNGVNALRALGLMHAYMANMCNKM